MLIGSIYGWELGRDDIFDPLSSRNRDDCLEPMRVLRDYALDRGVEIHTADVVRDFGLKADFNLYVESIPFDKDASGINCLLLLETHLTVPINKDFEYLNQFDEVFTWNTELLLAKRSGALNGLLDRATVTEIRVPNPVPDRYWLESINLGFSQRPQFACLIASNRHANILDTRELYSERVRAIRWYEKNSPQNFHLYGNGWTVPQKRYGKIGKLIYRLEKVLPFILRRAVFPSYQGPAVSKNEVLNKTRFCICFENAKDIPGYVTEKIFDCIIAGCIPVYFGEPNIKNWIPEDCFVDFRKFASYDALHQFLSTMKEETFISMQEAGRKFLRSNQFYDHSSHAFASKIIDRILSRVASDKAKIIN
jgi:hypothetical protein